MKSLYRIHCHNTSSGATSRGDCGLISRLNCAVALIILLSFGFTNAQTISYPEFGIYDVDNLPASFHRQNRERLMRSIGDTAVAVFYAASERSRNGDVDYRYRQSDNFFYLTGCNEPNSILLLSPSGILGADSNGRRIVHEILFVMPRDPKREAWTGKRLGTEGALKVLGIEAAMTTEKFEECLSAALSRAKVVYVPLQPEGLEGEVKSFAEKIAEAELQYNAAVVFKDPTPLLTRMRSVKSSEEIALMRKSAGMSAAAQILDMKACRAGMYEFQLQSIFEHACETEGAEYTAFPCICGSGENSVILHYESNRRRMADGDLVVMDCGCEYHNYASDITRTIPVNGRFSEPQLEIYRIVLAAHDSAVCNIKPGTSYYRTAVRKAAEVISAGLMKLGIIKDSSEYKKYFNHGLGHPVGLDVHDVMIDDSLRPGEIWTVEPGIYIPANTPGVDPKYWNIGVRIEDEVLVTATAGEVITSQAPIEPEAIERLMNQ